MKDRDGCIPEVGAWKALMLMLPLCILTISVFCDIGDNLQNKTKMRVVGGWPSWLIMNYFMNTAKEIMFYEIYFIKHYL